MDKIFIHTELIQLDQLLKWIGLIDSGSQVKDLLAEKRIFINDVLVAERRKKVHPGDVVRVEGAGQWEVVAKQDGDHED